MKYFIANWKANKNLKDAKEWADIFIKKANIGNKNLTVIICPPYPLIFSLNEKFKNIKNIFIGSQDVSMYEEGSYTGETSAKTMVGITTYGIIGHSERRKYFSETNNILFKKYEMTKKYEIEPIFCVRDEKDPIPESARFIAYEPVYAIGSGINEPAEKTVEMKKKLKIKKNNIFIYGGSVNEKNAIDYLHTNEIDGFLVGKVSLDPNRFADLVNLS